MKKLLLLGSALGLGIFFWSASTPSNKEDTMRMIKEEAERVGRTINEQELSDKLDTFTPEQLTIFHEFVRNFIARTPQTMYWMDKLRKSMEIDKKFWKDYEGIIFGT
jgi:hypothetical protein